eukprot:gene27814-34593_t
MPPHNSSINFSHGTGDTKHVDTKTGRNTGKDKDHTQLQESLPTRGHIQKSDRAYPLPEPTKGNYRPRASPGSNHKGDNLNEPHIRVNKIKTTEHKDKPMTRTRIQREEDKAAAMAAAEHHNHPLGGGGGGGGGGGEQQE